MHGQTQIKLNINFHIRTVHRDIINFFYSPTNAQMIVLKTTLKFTLKQLRHVSVLSVTPSSGSVLFVLAKVTLSKIANYGTSVCGDVAGYISGSLLVRSSLLPNSATYIHQASMNNALPDDGVTAPKHVGAIYCKF
jgi:hypothetical protein